MRFEGKENHDEDEDEDEDDRARAMNHKTRRQDRQGMG